MADLLPVDTTSAAFADLTPPIARLDVRVGDVLKHLAEERLAGLLDKPPLGHCPAEQPADWYEQVFDALVAAHPETCRETPGGQS
ncbi:hypothetical protein [Streptomyces sp. NPDC048272]|uniref:hypothetical protein n=1 Tax=Streptomyces sp. NPDC048272 TaxID=3154616 RepID=UPI0034331E66